MTRLIVKPHRPWRLPLLGLLLVGAMVAGGWSLYLYGRDQAGHDWERLQAHKVRLADMVEQLADENVALRERVAILEQGSEIDRQAYAEVQRYLDGQQSELFNLREELAFYRGVVTPPKGRSGLQIQDIKLEPDPGGQSFHYKLMLTHAGKNNESVRGEVTLAVDGSGGDVPDRLTLADMSQDGKSGKPFRFKYFQSLEGEIRLPEGFEPRAIYVEAKPEGKGKSPVEKTISWSEAVGAGG